MIMDREEELAKLREMDSKGLDDYFRISNIKKAGTLKAAINPRRYEVLTDKSKTIQEMADELDVEKRTVYSYRNLLIRYGFADKRELILENSVISRLKKFLDKKPSDIYEIRKGVKGFYPEALQHNRKIASIRSENQRLYYLKEQEKIAKKELKRRVDGRDELVLSALTRPMPIVELQKSAKTTYKRILNLEEKKKLLRARRVCGGKRRERIWLLEKDFMYKPGQEQDVADLVIQKIESIEELNGPAKSSITQRIQKALPEPIYSIVYQSYTTYFRTEDSEE
jgi:hypothetical protein